jgi:hypothetical protein
MEIIDIKAANRRQAFALPSRDTKRWVATRKAAVVIAVCNGAISRWRACERYKLSPEELNSWETAFKLYGTNGLQATYRYVSRKQVTRRS